MKTLHPCLWFDTQAEEAARFYTSLFSRSRIDRIAHYGEAAAEASGQKKDSVLTVEFELLGLKILGLNGGPIFRHTPALSLFVWWNNEKELDALWQGLSKDGTVRMGLDKYPWAKKYGWTADRFGVEWQIMFREGENKIAPAFLFVEKLFGKGEEAIGFYESVFPNSQTTVITRDEETKTVMHAIFSLAGQDFVLMEGKGKDGYTFSQAYSLVVECDTQEEIDHYWSKLSQGGETDHCGWLRDKYGVSWQITPSIIGELNASKDADKAERVMKAMLQMTKLDLKTLRDA